MSLLQPRMLCNEQASSLLLFYELKAYVPLRVHSHNALHGPHMHTHTWARFGIPRQWHTSSRSWRVLFRNHFASFFLLWSLGISQRASFCGAEKATGMPCLFTTFFMFRATLCIYGTTVIFPGRHSVLLPRFCLFIFLRELSDRWRDDPAEGSGSKQPLNLIIKAECYLKKVQLEAVMYCMVTVIMALFLFFRESDVSTVCAGLVLRGLTPQSNSGYERHRSRGLWILSTTWGSLTGTDIAQYTGL